MVYSGGCTGDNRPCSWSRFPLRSPTGGGGPRVSTRVRTSNLWKNRNQGTHPYPLSDLRTRSFHTQGLRISRRIRTLHLPGRRGVTNCPSHPVKPNDYVHLPMRSTDLYMDPYIVSPWHVSSPIPRVGPRPFHQRDLRTFRRTHTSPPPGDVVLNTCPSHPTESDDKVHSSMKLTDL